jgi:hypothetical protein
MLCCYQPVYTTVRRAIEVTTKDIRHLSTLLLKIDHSKYYLSHHFFLTINIKVPSKRWGQVSSVGTSAGYGLVRQGMFTGDEFLNHIIDVTSDETWVQFVNKLTTECFKNSFTTVFQKLLCSACYENICI